MKVEEVPIASLRPYENNPRKIPDKAISKVAKSLKTFGFQQPIVVDADMIVIVGHTRLLAAQKLGLKTVPVKIAELSAEKARAYRLADNRTNEETGWLHDILADEIKALNELDFDLDGLGFDDRELQAMLTDDEELERAEETPAIPENPVTVEGDVWLLGKHRIVCGDATKADDVAKALNGTKPHLMVTDPPYGVEYDANFRNGIIRQEGSTVVARAVGKVANDDRADWREAWELFPGDVAYIWHAGVRAKEVIDSLEAVGFVLRSQIIWSKNVIVIGRGNYHWQHEPCLYVVRKRTGATAHWQGDRTQSTVWKIDKPRKSETGHSTQKPIECMRRPIINNSSPGQAVYEPFSGSGTTLIAAEMTGRQCHAIEVTPAYVDVAVLRWQQFTGSAAILESDGRPFEEVASERMTKRA